MVWAEDPGRRSLVALAGLAPACSGISLIVVGLGFRRRGQGRCWRARLNSLVSMVRGGVFALAALGVSVCARAADVPGLSSYPQAGVKLYLNFTGAPLQDWGQYPGASAPAFDTDGDPNSFSSAEVGQIREIWARVAEKYSPFNVDVTTVTPADLSEYTTAQLIIGGDGAWTGGRYGGYSYPGGFRGSYSNIGWVFSKNLGQGFPKYVAEATAHEAGHLFGLLHQSTYDSSGNKVEEYSQGSADRAPVMGFSYYSQRGTWWRGTSSDGPAATQADLDIISGLQNGFGYRPDDHAGTMAGADLLEVVDGAFHGAGVIEQMTDVDYFRFSSAGGLVEVKARVAEFGPMLDLAMTLRDALGNVVASADTLSLGEEVMADLVAGDYYVTVSSHGRYGDVGQYFVDGAFAVGVPEPGALVLGTTIVVMVGRRRAGRRKDSAR
jgi:hypothetical protein